MTIQQPIDNDIKVNASQISDLLNSDLRLIISSLQTAGFEVRIVGGAVRDLILGLTPRDIDIITTSSPDETIFILDDNDIEVDVSGIKHGTVKAVFGDEKYEVTSLDFQIHRSSKNHIQTHYGNTWKDDALRRDFTINALSMDLDGNIYDYSNGVNDLYTETVEPLQSFSNKISEDPVLILRFFKMLTKFSEPKFSTKTIKIIKSNLDLLYDIPVKRLRKEMENLRNYPETLQFMKKLGLLTIVNDILLNNHP